MKPLILCILDGWGYSKAKEHNAIYAANTPNYDKLIKNHPYSLLEACGKAVGLPEGQMGNSEVGHMTIGSGRILLQDLPKIDKAIETGELANNPRIKELIENGKTVHLIGLISDGGVHSHINHIIALAKILMDTGISVKLHAITDGRDVSPTSSKDYIKQITDAGIEITTISGRFYAMDRDKRWERVEKAYDAIVNAKAPLFASPGDAIEACYNEDITDEFIIPHAHEQYSGMEDGDAMLIANFRADRVRQISAALFDQEFEGFYREQKKFSYALGMTSYSAELDKLMQTIFPVELPKNTLGEVIAKNGKKQLRIAETEKYAHVTFFFSGGREEVFEGEERILIPSPKVETYDKQPEMSAYELTDKLAEAVKSEKYDFICVNYANPDMVGHSGDKDATIKAIEAVDECLGKIMQATEASGGDLFVTADHGNAEQLLADDGGPLTSHTLNPVPFIYYGEQNITLKNGGLSDIAPTMLNIMGIEKPKEMSGAVLTK